MNPHKKNKVDVSTLTPEEQRLFRLYGKLPSKSDHFAKHLKERKYFDSGDYAMSKAGKADKLDTGSIGSQHPVPENIPHLTTAASATGFNGGAGHQHHSSISGASGQAAVGLASSPIKESSLLKSETSNSDETDVVEKGTAEKSLVDAKGIPIRK